jgi:hypothetical protein
MPKFPSIPKRLVFDFAALIFAVVVSEFSLIFLRQVKAHAR